MPILDVSIYYRGKLFHQEEVGGSQCLLVYQPSDPAVALRPGRLVRFPSPAELADGKQRRFTEELLGSAGLQLEQRARKLFATRLKKCKVFWALSQQLEGVGDPPPNLLCRDQETPIFDFNEFCTGGQGCCSPPRFPPIEVLGLMGASSRMSQASKPSQPLRVPQAHPKTEPCLPSQS